MRDIKFRGYAVEELNKLSKAIIEEVHKQSGIQQTLIMPRQCDYNLNSLSFKYRNIK